MSITYALAEYTADDATVEATYTNADGHTHTRTLIIQKNEDGTINQDAWDDVLAATAAKRHQQKQDWRDHLP